MPRLLDQNLLEELAARLSAQGTPAIEAAQPGLPEEALADPVGELGLSFPSEARVWWGWRNGVPSAAGAPTCEIGPGRRWLPLEEAIAECLEMRQLHTNIREQMGLSVDWQPWRPTWLPVIGGPGVYVLETDVPDHRASPVRVFFTSDPEPPSDPDLSSLGELVLAWIDALDRGAWRYDHVKGYWEVDHELLDSWPLAKRGVV